MIERAGGRGVSVARQVLLLQITVLALLVGVGATLAVVHERDNSDDQIRRQVRSIAETLALSDATASALSSPDPTAILQPQTERIRVATGVDFIVVMAPDRTRYTHTNPELIGQPFTGNIDRALDGETTTETYAGSLGPSIRSVTPVHGSDGAVVGLVSAGVTRERISRQFAQSVPTILAVAGGGLVLALLSSLLVNRRLRRQTLGLAAEELRTMYEHHDAVLHSIGEGLVVIGHAGGKDERVDVVNDEARRLLDLGDGPVPLSAVPTQWRTDAVSSTKDQVHLTDKRVLLVNRHPVTWSGGHIGTVVTIRDHTELQNVLGELDSVRSFAESLRSQAHESANRLHSIITMVELGRYDEAVTFATDELQVSQELIDRLMNAVHEPALAALLLGKLSEATERGVELSVTDDTALGPVPSLDARELVTLVGNLVDNAIDAARASDAPWVEVTVMEEDSMLVVAVADSGPGMTPEALDTAKRRGYSTKSGSRGLGLALVSQVVSRHGGTLTTEPALGSMLLVRIPIHNSSAHSSSARPDDEQR
ncbi:two-component system CitB family sensor kinase [Rhodococcus sp. 27YEA15]|uniref:sensor histidine kinase n=1 Tax=Rhodococcus sp. 27YEA15 TaxID=3156259 RepID=UPI003C7DC5A3